VEGVSLSGLDRMADVLALLDCIRATPGSGFHLRLSHSQGPDYVDLRMAFDRKIWLDDDAALLV